MMSQEGLSHERDMSRAEWQRSIGAVVFTQAMDHLLAEGPIELPDMHDVNVTSTHWETVGYAPSFWTAAHLTVAGILENRLKTGEYQPSPDARQGIHDYTYYRTPLLVIQEGIKAQVGFPLNMAQLISQEAAYRGVTGYEIGGHAQLATFLRREDFRSMIHTALLARNGAWEHISVNAGLPADIHDAADHRPITSVAQHVARGIQFTDGKVDFTEAHRRELLQELQIANAHGNSLRGVHATRTSSGCPVRHLRPQFTPGDESQATLGRLAEYYDLTVEELTTPRRQTVVEDGLDFMAELLDNFDDLVVGRYATYSGSAQSPRSAGQPLAGHA